VILPECIDQSFEIHTGKQFLTVRVTEDMVGHKFGEFASTRKKVFHKKPKVAKKK
jgi:small subunit ribosomal protein S19